MTHPAELRHASRGDTLSTGRSSGRLIFTDYVRSLIPGQEPDAETFRRVWSTLRGALFAEMRKRSLWKLPPDLFGIYGRASWSEAGAFDELASDCYCFIFLERLPALQAQLKVKQNVEGLVFRNIRNFLHDVQKKNDPVGYKTYRVVRLAVDQLVDAGTLHAAHGGPHLGSDTVLGSTRGSAERARPGELEIRVREWCDDLASDIVTARGKRRDDVARRLGSRIAELPGEGVEAFRLGDLIDGVKGAVRVRWSLLGASLEGETALDKLGGEAVRRVRVVRPDSELEHRQSMRHLRTHMTRRLRRESPRGRRELRRLWRYLWRHAERSGRATTPSRRQIARQLGISRHRLTRYFDVLGRWVRQARDAA